MTKEIFTKNELPENMIMFVKKQSNGKELAAIVSNDANDNYILGTFKALVNLADTKLEERN